MTHHTNGISIMERLTELAVPDYKRDKKHERMSGLKKKTQTHTNNTFEPVHFLNLKRRIILEYDASR